MQLSNKLVLVTGASRGIGASLLSAMGLEGAIVAGTATTDKGRDNITEIINSSGLKGKGFVLDLTNDDSINNLFQSITEEFGKMPDILINNAGITKDNLFIRMKDSEWFDVINTNLTGIYKITKSCIKSMLKARWGRIINIASVSGIMGNPGQTNYAAAKAGVIGFSKSLAKEVASRGITVNVIAPGFVATDMTSHFKEEEINNLLSHIPVGRFAKPEEISSVAVMLSSDNAAYITGETINVNGGLHMV